MTSGNISRDSTAPYLSSFSQLNISPLYSQCHQEEAGDGTDSFRGRERSLMRTDTSCIPPFLLFFPMLSRFASAFVYSDGWCHYSYLLPLASCRARRGVEAIYYDRCINMGGMAGNNYHTNNMGGI